VAQGPEMQRNYPSAGFGGDPVFQGCHAPTFEMLRGTYMAVQSFRLTKDFRNQAYLSGCRRESSPGSSLGSQAVAHDREANVTCAPTTLPYNLQSKKFKLL
jgi:hypothetical protein